MNFSNKKYKYNSFGLRERDLKHIRVALFAYEKIQNAVIFGSRAMGNYKKASDIDIAIIGKDIKRNIVGRLSGLLNYELPIPYFVEVVHYEALNNEALKKHIREQGKLIYEK